MKKPTIIHVPSVDEPEVRATLMTLVARLVNSGLSVEQFDLKNLKHEDLVLGDFEIRVVKLD